MAIKEHLIEETPIVGWILIEDEENFYGCFQSPGKSFEANPELLLSLFIEITKTGNDGRHCQCSVNLLPDAVEFP